MSPLLALHGSGWHSVQLPPTPPVLLPMSPVARSATPPHSLVVPEQSPGLRRPLPARSSHQMALRVVQHGSPKALSRASTPTTPNAPWLPAGVVSPMPRPSSMLHPRSGSPGACRVSSLPFGIQGAMVAPPNTLRVLRPSVSMPSISAVCLMPVLQGRRMAAPIASRAESPPLSAAPSYEPLRHDTPIMASAKHRGRTPVTQLIKGRRTPPSDGAGADFTMAPTPARARGGLSGAVSPPPSPQLLSTPEVNTRSLLGESGSDPMLGTATVPGVGGAGRPPPPPMPPPPMPPPTQLQLQASCGGGRLEAGHT